MIQPGRAVLDYGRSLYDSDRTVQKSAGAVLTKARQARLLRSKCVRGKNNQINLVDSIIFLNVTPCYCQVPSISS